MDLVCDWLSHGVWIPKRVWIATYLHNREGWCRMTTSWMKEDSYIVLPYLIPCSQVVVRKTPTVDLHPPQATCDQGITRLSHLRQPLMQAQRTAGIMESWLCPHTRGLSSLIPATAQKSRCRGTTNLRNWRLPLTVRGVDVSVRVTRDLDRPEL
jgi:hypothetical protein